MEATATPSNLANQTELGHAMFIGTDLRESTKPIEWSWYSHVIYFCDWFLWPIAVFASYV